MNYEIHIGEVWDMTNDCYKPKQIIEITSEQLTIIHTFAHIRKDSELNEIYRINDCEFKITPKLNIL